MKKTFSFAFIFILIFSLSISVFAQETEKNQETNMKTYHIEEAKMSISVPANFKMITPKSKKDDPFFTETTADYEQTIKLLNDRKITANFIDVKTEAEFYITIDKTQTSEEIVDYRLMPPTKKQQFLSQASGKDFKNQLNTIVENGVSSSNVTGFVAYDKCEFFTLNSVISKNDKLDIASSASITCADKKMVAVTYALPTEKNVGVTTQQLELSEKILNTIKFDDTVHETYQATLKEKNLTATIAGIVSILIFIGIMGYCIHIVKKRNKNGSNKINPLRR